MKWSWKLGRFAGINVNLHLTFVLFIFWIALFLMGGDGFRAMLSGVAFMLALFASVLLHEFGHALTARKYGIQTRDITLLPIGGISRLERMPDQPKQELAVTLAGPAVNIGIAAAIFTFLYMTGSLSPLDRISLTQGSLLERVMLANLSLVFFNLLPAFPMDGGRALRALLALRMSYGRATQVAATVGQGFALIFGLLGLLVSPVLVLIAVFVWFGASEEASAALMKVAFSNTPVSKAMLTDFQVLHEQDTLARAVELILKVSQHDFPVMEGDRVTGLLSLKDLIAALARHGPEYHVVDAMRRDVQAVGSSDPLEEVFMRLGQSRDYTIPVTDSGALVGLLTSDNLAEFFMLHTALQESARTKESRAA
jgi:Zn-dependent protease/CBS domain-containing protein